MFQPINELKTIDGANMLMPVLKPRDNKNKKEVSVRVLRSNRFSKNS